MIFDLNDNIFNEIFILWLIQYKFDWPQLFLSDKYNLMMDPNDKTFDFLDPLSPALGLLKTSPYLSPLLGFDSIKNSERESQNDLINFRLDQDELEEMIPEPVFKDDFDDEQSQRVSQIPEESKHQEDQQQELIDQSVNPPLLILIRLLINHSGSPDQDLIRKAEEVTAGSKKLMEVYKILLKKFKKLKKTKEQMTKYCMRKAFKCITQKIKITTSPNKKSISPSKSPKSNSSFSSIFKKVTTEKTMNGNFLKKIFTQDGFLEDYEVFLNQFKGIIQQDNEKKVRYLAGVIHGFLSDNNIKKIETIKRLPWTKQILQKTEELGRQLPQYADPQNTPVSRRVSSRS